MNDTVVRSGSAAQHFDGAPARTARLVEGLRRAGAYPHPAGDVKVIETHISYVLLAGDFAYKIKKPVRLGFLDFSSPQARRFFCEEEVRLNRRTAPGLYLGVVAIGGDPPTIGAHAEPCEHAVKMRRFRQEDLLDHMAREGRLEPAQVDALAAAVARMHAAAPRAEAGDARDAVERAAQPALDNFRDIAALEAGGPVRESLLRLREWTLHERGALARTFASRRIDGFVRECHGDLHLANVVLAGGEPVPYDCIEFDPRMRWIDVMSDVAFTVMDLAHLGSPRLAARFLSAYLERTGDYAGLRVLRFYLVYRAMVRAKIACIRAHQPGASDRAHALAHAELVARLGLAERLARRPALALLLMHGLPGSGKTTASQVLLEALGAVRLRSDVERKRLHGLAASARSASAPGAGIYSPVESLRAYARLSTLAYEVLAAGYPVVVDAASLSRGERERFRHVAHVAGAAFEIVDCVAPEATLRSRLARRASEARDASEADVAVLERLCATREPLGDDERMHCVVLDTGHPGEWRAAAESLARRFHLSTE